MRVLHNTGRVSERSRARVVAEELIICDPVTSARSPIA
ncbi:MAG: hypothetical protein JSU65_02425 [Candidatus Zixiibacteriota bacterium]|nr:MAG: hypothetical protein JSU65_02425 [candidate division Zixibacteria bacterium]